MDGAATGRHADSVHAVSLASARSDSSVTIPTARSSKAEVCERAKEDVMTPLIAFVVVWIALEVIKCVANRRK